MPAAAPESSRAAATEARIAKAAWAGLVLVLVVIVFSVAIRIGEDSAGAGLMRVLRGVHRASASAEVLAAIALVWLAWRRSLAVAALTIFLSVLGILAGQKPPPLAALGNLLGGLALAAAFAWVLGRAHGRAPQERARLGDAAAALFAVQCALGAWLSLFAAELWSWALLAHALLGVALAAGAAWLSLRLAKATQRFALLAVALAAPAAGAASALFEQPLGASVAHAAAAALLVTVAAYAHARLRCARPRAGLGFPLTHIKGGGGAEGDGAGMKYDAGPLIEAALHAARAGDWAGYRLRFAELRATCEPLIEAHEDLRQQFETLGAAAPQYDPEGCVAAFEALGGLLRSRYAGELRSLQRQPPAPLDLRGLQPPEPIVRIFEALDRAPGEPLRAILPHEPVPLYALLRERGYSYSGMQRADGGYELLIERT